MSSFYDDASLVVIPSGYKTSKVYAEKPTDGSGDLTFTRTGDTATRVNSAGLIEKVRTNLFLQSQTFDNASWAKSNITVTANTTVAPDGTTTADTFVSLGVTSEHAVRATTSMAVNTEHTASVYVKQTNTRYAYIRDLTNNAVAIYDLQDGVVSLAAGTSTSITAVGSFYRISMTFVTPAVIVNNLIDLGITTSPSSLSSLVPVNDTMVFWAAQLETGVATSYIPTTTAAVSVGPVANVPRLDYLGSTCPRLLLEPQRTNLVTYSEQLDNAAWTKLFLGVTANNATSPDGSTNAEKLIPDATLNTHLFFQTITPAAGVYTLSAFFKAGEYNFACLRLSTDSDTKRFAVVLNLTTGVITATDSLGSPTSTSSKVENYGNGWYRLSISSAHASGIMYPTFAVSSTAVPTFSNSLPLFTGNGTSGIFAYGCQLELGAYSTSLIPTLAASATRGADACSKTGISSLIGQTEGVLFVDWNYENKTDANGSIPIILTGSGGEAYIYVSGAGTLLGELYNSGLQASIAGAIGSVGRKKIAFAYKQNDFVLYLNGVQIGTDTSGTVGSLTGLFVGSYYTSGYSSNTGINQALLFKTRLTNAELAELTTL